MCLTQISPVTQQNKEGVVLARYVDITDSSACFLWLQSPFPAKNYHYIPLNPLMDIEVQITLPLRKCFFIFYFFLLTAS